IFVSWRRSEPVTAPRSDMVCARLMPGSGSARAPALDCFFEARVVCEFQYGLKNKLEEGKLFMQSLFKKIRSSRTTRIVGCGLALLLVGVSLASYSYKGTKSFGKNADNKSSLVQASQPSQAKINESVGKLPLAFEPNQGQVDPRVKFRAGEKVNTELPTEKKPFLVVRGSKAGVLRMKMQNAQPATS